MSNAGGKAVRTALSQNLKHYRSGREWSQADLAEKAEISITFLSALERGTKWAYPDTLSNLAAALDIEVYQLFMPPESKGVQTPDETRHALTRFYEDVSIALKKSVVETMKDSLENVFKRHTEDGLHKSEKTTPPP